MAKLLSDERERLMDYTYGVRHHNNKWMIGDSVLENYNFLIKGVRYKGTPGLYELIFMKHPKEDVYTEADLKAYKAVLIATNAHKVQYKQNARINTNKGHKYKNIISLLFPSKALGRGHEMTYTTEKIDYVHWDNPNELVERLKLLIASQRAGHTGHTNEIVSIIEELREAGIIV